jgi:hypothetical protein
MMPHALWSEAWTAALLNHLWQSTLFVLKISSIHFAAPLWDPPEQPAGPVRSPQPRPTLP